MIKAFDKETEYFFRIIKSAINETALAPADEGISWSRIIELADKQDVFGIMAEALRNKTLPAEASKALNDYEKSQIVHMIAMNNELKCIEKELSELGIRFMLLKGARIRDFYPKQIMRQMGDFDLLYDIENRDKVIALMTERGYTQTSEGGNSEDFTKPPFYTFEFHHDLFKDVYGFCPDFSFVWDRAEVSPENPFRYEMTLEDIYVHSLAHMYKHFLFGGFGIRFIIDNYLIIKSFSESLDEEYISSRVTEMKLVEFRKTIDELSVSFFEGELSEEQIEFINARIMAGVYGSHIQNVEEIYSRYRNENESRSVAGFVLRRVFPSREQMLSIYPALRSKPYLLPLYYVKRIFTRSSKGLRKVLKELKFIKKIEDK